MSVWDGGEGEEVGTFSRLSEHPTAAATAAAVSQTRRRGHPPSGGKKKEQKKRRAKSRSEVRNRARLTRENEERPGADEMGVGESATSC